MLRLKAAAMVWRINSARAVVVLAAAALREIGETMLKRLLKHLSAPGWWARRAFRADDLAAIGAAVKAAEDVRVKAALPRGYQPIEGAPAYNQAVQNLLLGKDSALIANGQVITAQALGGTGALKIGADYLKRLSPNAKVYISDPSWENHRALFESRLRG